MFSTIALIAFVAIGLANNSESSKTASENMQKVRENKNDEEALYSEVKTANGGTISCWVFDCNELAKTVLKDQDAPAPSGDN